MQDIAALYIRLSMDDGDLDEQKVMSVSVQNQRLHLRNYLMDHPEIDARETKEYIDDGYSGTNMERPAMQKLLEDVRNRNIACVLVKDFSGFGRNYLEVGKYLEQIFPYMGVRFIAIDDGYDSGDNRGDVPGLDVVFKNIIHDYYSKELSIKVLQTRKKLAQKGLFMGGIPPFGYIRSDSDRHKLAVDPESAKTVQRIFAYTLDGKSQREIVRIFNREHVENPYGRLIRLGIKKGSNEEKSDNKLKWTTYAIGSILRSQAVIGSVTNHRVERKTLGRVELKVVPKQEHIVVSDMHEAIIDEDMFEQVQEMIRQRREKVSRESSERKSYLLSGTLTCGYCGRKLRRSSKGRHKYYCKYETDYQEHPSIEIVENDVKEVLFALIPKLMRLEVEKLAEDKKLQDESRERRKKESKKKFGKVRNTKQIMAESYERFTSGVIGREEFMKVKEQISKECVWDGTEESKTSEKKESKNKTMENKMKEIVNAKDTTWLTKELLKSVIEQIQVFPNHRIRIVWKCGDIFGEQESTHC